MSEKNQVEEIDFELPVEEVTKMLQSKTVELNSANEELAKLKVRSLKVFEENQLLQFSPQYAEQAAEMKFHLEMARQFTASGAFPNQKPEQIYTLMKAGNEMGMKPLESLSSLYILKGKIEPYGKGMIAILTKKGYRLKYTNETPTSCTVTASNEKEGFEGSETVTTDDPIIKKSNAFKIAPKNKLRFHAIRMLLNFQLPHLISSTADLFETHHIEANQDENGNTKVITDNVIFENLNSCENLESLESYYNENKATITKRIVLINQYGKLKKSFEND